LASRPIAAPYANQIDAILAAGGWKRSRTVAANSAAATVIEMAASSCGPSSALRPGASTEYAGR
jgi:hypothetical protein